MRPGIAAYEDGRQNAETFSFGGTLTGMQSRKADGATVNHHRCYTVTKLRSCHSTITDEARVTMQAHTLAFFLLQRE